MAQAVAAVDVEGMSASEISDYVENDLVPSLESLEGVASVSTTGQLDESIQVTMNQDKTDALNRKIKKSIDKQFIDAQKKIDNSSAKVESGKQSMTSGQDQLSDALNTSCFQPFDHDARGVGLSLLNTRKCLSHRLVECVIRFHPRLVIRRAEMYH